MRSRLAILAFLVPLLALVLPPAVAADQDADYVIGVEDLLQIFVWNEPDLSLRVIVRPDGKITVPLVNDIKVAGLTTDQVRSKITEALSVYIRQPNVTVIVQEINSYRVYFLGEINRQGAMQFYRPIRLLQAIAAAGGLTEYAKKEVVLLREQGSTERRIPIDYKRLLAGDPGQENLWLEPGDTLIFP